MLLVNNGEAQAGRIALNLKQEMVVCQETSLKFSQRKLRHIPDVRMLGFLIFSVNASHLWLPPHIIVCPRSIH